MTLGSVLSAAAAAVVLVAAPRSDARDAVVGLALAFCMLCDRCDGWLARRLGVASATGAQLDSLADAVAFGVVPALWVVGRVDADAFVFVAALAFVGSAVVRLARFHSVGLVDGRFGPGFTGMPTLCAAAVVGAVVAVDNALDVAGAAVVVVEGAALVVCSLLMHAPLYWPKRTLSPGALPFFVLVPASVVALFVVAAR